MAEAEEEIHDAVGAEREADELPSALVRPPLGQILRNSLDRPWLGLYRVPSATSNGGASADEEDRGFGLAPGEEVWVKICTSLPFLDLGRLGMVCTTLQRATANPALWEARCLKAWRLPGFVPCTDVLLEYGWSWRRMFLTRPRLRTDGVYHVEVTTYTRGMPEGRGMKEAGRDFYQGKLVQAQYWRYLRFCPDGRVVLLTTWRPPPVVARVLAKAGTRGGAEHGLRKLGAAVWGDFQVVSDDARSAVRLRVEGVVRLDEYPGMKPSTVHYELLLDGGQQGRLATNASLVMLAHYSSFAEDGSDVLEHALPQPNALDFCSFDRARRLAHGHHHGAAAAAPPPDAAAAGASATDAAGAVTVASAGVAASDGSARGGPAASAAAPRQAWAAAS